MPTQRTHTNLALRYAAASHVGKIRTNNEDAAYAGPSLLAVADGMGGHAAGEVAAQIAIRSLAPVDTEVAVETLIDTLGRAVMAANQAIAARAAADPAAAGMGTTLTALLWSGLHVAVAHIGDSRAYLLRDGELYLITTDHTPEQLLAEGSGAPPRHSTQLTRALNGGVDTFPDLTMREARLGDRYLLCSDGLSGPVDADDLCAVLSTVASPGDAVVRLVEAANQAGGPDNVTAVVADVTGGPAPRSPVLVVGAATDGRETG
jgi:protein phosphatase